MAVQIAEPPAGLADASSSAEREAVLRVLSAAAFLIFSKATSSRR